MAFYPANAAEDANNEETNKKAAKVIQTLKLDIRVYNVRRVGRDHRGDSENVVT